MAPFPTSVRSRNSGSANAAGGGLLPLHSPLASTPTTPNALNGAGAMHAYPPALSPRSGSPVDSAHPAGTGAGTGMGAGETPQQRLQRLDPRRLFGAIKAPNHGGILKGGLGAITHESTETVRRCLEVSPPPASHALPLSERSASAMPSSPRPRSRRPCWILPERLQARSSPQKGPCASSPCFVAMTGSPASQTPGAGVPARAWRADMHRVSCPTTRTRTTLSLACTCWIY